VVSGDPYKLDYLESKPRPSGGRLEVLKIDYDTVYLSQGKLLIAILLL